LTPCDERRRVVWWAWFLDDDHDPADTTLECLACSATVTDLRYLGVAHDSGVPPT
jgi:hypothetical protein